MSGYRILSSATTTNSSITRLFDDSTSEQQHPPSGYSARNDRPAASGNNAGNTYYRDTEDKQRTTFMITFLLVFMSLYIGFCFYCQRKRARVERDNNGVEGLSRREQLRDNQVRQILWDTIIDDEDILHEISYSSLRVLHMHFLHILTSHTHRLYSTRVSAPPDEHCQMSRPWSSTNSERWILKTHCTFVCLSPTTIVAPSKTMVWNALWYLRRMLTKNTPRKMHHHHYHYLITRRCQQPWQPISHHNPQNAITSLSSPRRPPQKMPVQGVMMNATYAWINSKSVIVSLGVCNMERWSYPRLAAAAIWCVGVVPAPRCVIDSAFAIIIVEIFPRPMMNTMYANTSFMKRASRVGCWCEMVVPLVADLTFPPRRRWIILSRMRQIWNKVSRMLSNYLFGNGGRMGGDLLTSCLAVLFLCFASTCDGGDWPTIVTITSLTHPMLWGVVWVDFRNIVNYRCSWLSAILFNNIISRLLRQLAMLSL